MTWNGDRRVSIDHLMTSRNQKTLIGLLLVIVVGLFFVASFLAAAVVGWKAAQRAGNEAATIQNLKTIAAAEIQYFNTHNRTYGTFDELVKGKMLSSKFVGNPPITDGYVLKLTLTPKPNGSVSSYTLTADPLDDSSGKRHYYFDSTSGQIHVNEDRGAGPNDPPL